MTTTPATREEVVELMARAHDREDAAQKGEPSPWDWDLGECPTDADWAAERKASMDAALTALERRGLALIPLDPTSRMKDVGARSMLPNSWDFAHECYVQMLASSPYNKETGNG